MPATNNNLKLPAIQKIRHEQFYANSACYFLRSTAVIRYHHATAGFPVKETWCTSIANGNYNIWLVVKVELVRRCFPDADETIIGTMSQKRKISDQLKRKILKKKRLP